MLDSDTSVLNKLLAEDLLGLIHERDGHVYARLKETDKQSTLKQVDISHIPKGSLLIKLDKCDQPKKLFKGKGGECKRCDYVLITAIGKQPFLIFIEMKSKRISKKEVILQFKSAECIIDYCDAVLERFYETKKCFQKYNKRFVVLYMASSQKTPTRKNTVINDTPEKALYYNSNKNVSLKAVLQLH